MYQKGEIMKCAKVFENGRSQAVRLPKEYRVNDSEVSVNKVGDIIMLIPKKSKWNSLIKSLDIFTDDYMDERNQGVIDKREEL